MEHRLILLVVGVPLMGAVALGGSYLGMRAISVITGRDQSKRRKWWILIGLLGPIPLWIEMVILTFR